MKKIVALVSLYMLFVFGAFGQVKVLEHPMVYPPLALMARVTGKVTIVVHFNKYGHSITFVGGHPLLIETCEKAVRAWKFESIKEEDDITITFVFGLVDSKEKERVEFDPQTLTMMIFRMQPYLNGSFSEIK